MNQINPKCPSGFLVIRKLFLRYFKDQVGRSSAELAYYLLFSLFPLLIFVNAVLSMLHLSTDTLASALGIVLPPQAADIITTYLSYIQGLDTKLLLYACLFLAVYAISRSITSLMHSVSRAYRVRRKGFFITIVGIVFSVLLLLSVVLLFGLTMISDNLLLKVGQYITLPAALIQVWNLLRLLAAPIYMFIVLTCFYYIVGYGEYTFWQAIPGSGCAVVVWFLATSAFSYYIGHISRYSVLYGSLAAIMILMLWFFITGVVLIMGGELNYVLAHRNDDLPKHEGADKT